MRRLAPVVVVALALVAAPAAQAGTISRQSNEYVYTSTADVENALQLNYCTTCGAPLDGNFLFKDAGEGVTIGDGSGCGPSGIPDFTVCPGAGIARWTSNLGPGNDKVEIGVGSDPWPIPMTSNGEAGADILNGGPFGDSLNGGTGNDTLAGSDGNDVLDGGFGSDSIAGGAGTADMASYASRSDGVNVNLGAAGADDGSSNDGPAGTRDTISTTDIEGVTGSDGADTLSGSDLTTPLTIEGGGGGDSITGGLGPNTLFGGAGGDTIHGSGDEDTVHGDAGDDFIDPLGGEDTVFGETGFDRVESRDGEVDHVDCGGDGDDSSADQADVVTNCAPPGPPAPVQPVVVDRPVLVPSRLLFDLAYTYTAGRRSTKLRNIALEVESGAHVTAACRTPKGARCRGTRDVGRARASSTVRLRGFEGKALPVGSKLQLRATKDGMIGAVKTLTIRKRKAPTLKTLCIPVGATSPSAC